MSAPSPPQIAPSILSAEFARLGEHVRAVVDAGAQVVHVDVMDGHFVPPITFGPLAVEAVRAACGDEPYVDVHLMIERPEAQIEAFAAAGADGITVHAEATAHAHRTLTAIRAAGCRAGLAVNPATPVDVFAHVRDEVDLALCMTVNPGWGGQTLIPGSLDKARRLRELLDDDVVVMVDGGVDRDSVERCVTAGAGWLVAGSAVFGARDPGAAYRELAELSARAG